MKFSLILCATIFMSSFAHAQQQRKSERSDKVYASSLSGYQSTRSIKEKLKHVDSCEEGYNLVRRKIDNLNPSGEMMAGVGMGSYFVGYALFGTTLGVLVYPAAALYTVGVEIRGGAFLKAEKLIHAARYCNERNCNFKPLVKVRNWLEKKHDISVSNRELAELVNSHSESMELCTSEIKEDGTRKMKTYKELRNAIKDELLLN